MGSVVRRSLLAVAITLVVSLVGCADAPEQGEVADPIAVCVEVPGAVGCDGGTAPADASRADGGHDAASDGGTDGGLDAGRDGGTDAATDGGADAATDAGADAPTDAHDDAPTDAATDAPEDAPTDAPEDAPTDAATDAPEDAATDAATDAAPDAAGPVCGDGTCNGTEDACNCPQDCANPMTPVCDRRGASAVSPQNPAGFCAGMCDGRCQSRWWRWSFWVTQYNVSETWGWGEHQGIAIFGDQYTYDERFGFATPGAAVPPWRHPATGGLWRQGDRVTGERQFEMRTTNPSGEAPEGTQLNNVAAGTSAFCGHTRTSDQPIYNHGRTLARAVPSDRWYRTRNLIPMRNLASSNQCQRRDGSWCYNPTRFAPATLDRCFRGITDGLCESACGNCSYVAVTQDVTNGGITYWEQINERRPLPSVFGPRLELGRQVSYVGGTSPFGVVARTNVNFWRTFLGTPRINSTAIVDAPFTHCVDRTDEARFPGAVGQNPQQYVLDARNDALTGIWGHNSNTDAEAELTMFSQCDASPARVLMAGGLASRVCGVCGVDEGQAAPTQAPCRRKTNTAALWWARTSGIHNVDDWAVGLWPGFAGDPLREDNASWRASPPRPVPQCNWSGARVWGM